MVIRLLFFTLIALAGCSGGFTNKMEPGLCSAEPSVRRDLLNSINDYRRENGAGPVELEKRLTDLAGERIRHFFGRAELYGDHITPPRQWLVSMGYPAAAVGENILRLHSIHPGEITGALIHKTWSNRGRERANLLDPDYKHAGFDMKPDSKGCYALLLLSD